jgi:hypothetical protein
VARAAGRGVRRGAPPRGSSSRAPGRRGARSRGSSPTAASP